MRPLILLFLLSLSFSAFSQSESQQNSSSKKSYRYTIWVDPIGYDKPALSIGRPINAQHFYSMDNRPEVGALIQINESTLVFSASTSLAINSASLNEWSISDIEGIVYKRKGSGGTGFTGGFVAGLLTGVVASIGNSNCREIPGLFGSYGSQATNICKSNSGEGILGGLILGLGGGILGAIIGGGKKRIGLSGKQDKYKRKRKKLENLLLQQQ